MCVCVCAVCVCRVCVCFVLAACVALLPRPHVRSQGGCGGACAPTHVTHTHTQHTQVLASRPDVMREDYMNELCTLQDDVPPFPDAEVCVRVRAVCVCV